jgi:hypothetical protein
VEKEVAQVTEGGDRVQDALAAYLEYLEMGGTEPDTSHLTSAEERELQELIDALELTEGVAFGRGRGETTAAARDMTTTPEGARLLAQLRESLPPSVRIDPDENTLVSHIGGIEIVDRSIVGTFGGRVRVWLLDAETARVIEETAECLTDLNRVFGMFPDMSAVALVGKDMSCLIVQPEDCAPQIQVPSGSLIARRYKRAIQPVPEAVRDFLEELIPYWDPMPAFDPESGLRIDISEVGEELARAAIQNQRGIGERARKGNPKKDALLTFGNKEVSALKSLAKGLFEGSVEPADVEDRIDRLATGR